MAFIFRNVEPTEIIYNGVSLTVLKYGNTAVWGKPFAFSLTKDSHTTVTVTRTASPNQNATLGTLSNGDTIYYGDTLTFVFSADSGYKINTNSINGSILSTGQSVTVTENISVEITSVESYSWHSLWTGSKYVTTNTKITTNDKLALKYRATVTTLNETWGYEYTQTVELEVDTTKTVYGTYDMGGGDLADETCGTLKLTLTMENLDATIYGTFASRTGSDSGDPYTMTITKLEGYY